MLIRHIYPAAGQANQVTGEKYRITMLTEGLVRLEYSEDGAVELDHGVAS